MMNCVEWDGYRDKDGYGVIHPRRGVKVKAHRQAYADANGIDARSDAMPEVVMHSCDNPPCVNPDHLVGGTAADNVADKIAKGRLRVPIGEGHPNSKLNRFSVRLARLMYANGGTTQARIAAYLGVSEGAVQGVINLSRWSHVR